MDFSPTQVQREIPERIACILNRASAAPENGKPIEGRRSEIILALDQAEMLDFVGEGGAPYRFLDAAIIAESLARLDADAASEFCVNAACRAMLAKGANSSRAAQIGRRFAFALTEAESGSDVSSLKTTATFDSDLVVIFGEKAFVTGAEWADYVLTVARVAHGSEGANLSTGIFAVPLRASGLTLQLLSKMTGNAYPTFRMSLRGVRLAADAMICPLSGSWSVLAFGGLVERMLIAASITGLAQGAWDELASRVKARTLFGKPVAQFQTIRHRMADLATQIEAMRRMTHFAGWSIDRNSDTHRSVNMAKLFCAETGQSIITECLKMSGGAAYLADDAVNLAWRQSALALFAGGVAETQRDAIARCVGLGAGAV